MEKKKLRYGIIGAGTIADKKHLSNYALSDEVQMLAVCDPDVNRAQAMADKYNIPMVFADCREMFLEVPLDFVSVCSPNAFHEDAVILALDSGIHVHCEKPLSTNAASVRRMLQAQKKSGRLLMPAMNNRFTNASFFLKQYIETGNLGEIYSFRCGWMRQRGIPGKGGWFTNSALSGGGPLIDLGVHMLDLGMYLTDNWNPTTVSAAAYANFFDNRSRNGISHGTEVSDVKADVEDTAMGFIRFENGCTASFEFGWASNIGCDRKYVEILGTKGGALLYNNKLTLHHEVADTLMESTPDTNYKHDACNEFAHFIECIRHGNEPLVKVEQAVRVMEVIDAAYASASKACEVSISSDVPGKERHAAL